MVQKMDKTNTETKKANTTSSDTATKNQPHLNKHSNKSSKNAAIKRSDPSGLPKYR